MRVARGALARSLLAVPLDARGRYAGGVARWLARDWPLDCRRQSIRGHGVALDSRPGGTEPRRARAAHRLGRAGYRVDPAFAERRRMQVVRDKQGGYTVDLALDSGADRARHRQRRPEGAGVDELTAAATALTALTVTYARPLEASVGDVLPPGVPVPKRALDVIVKTAAEARQLAPVRDAQARGTFEHRARRSRRRRSRSGAPLPELRRRDRRSGGPRTAGPQCRPAPRFRLRPSRRRAPQPAAVGGAATGFPARRAVARVGLGAGPRHRARSLVVEAHRRGSVGVRRLVSSPPSATPLPSA